MGCFTWKGQIVPEEAKEERIRQWQIYPSRFTSTYLTTACSMYLSTCCWEYKGFTITKHPSLEDNMEDFFFFFNFSQEEIDAL